MLQKKDLLNLNGKVAVISGASSGLGLATAQLLSAYGAKIAMLDVQEELGKKEAELINKEGRTAEFFYCDVTDIENVKNTVDEIVNKFGKIDILFNNAGVAIRKTVVDLSENDWNKVLDVSLKGVFLFE